MRTPEFWYDRPDGAWPALLGPAAALYAAAGILRQALTWERPAPVPVVCVGNLVVGGAGKTPVALAVAGLARAAGAAPVFLTRGYGGRGRGPVRVDPAAHTAADVGDEPLLLAAAAPTWVAPDRVAGANAAGGDGTLIIMDDGFQNPTLKKDLSFVVIDGATGLGNGRVMPAGPLREPVGHGLMRADAVILLGKDTSGTAARLHTTLPVLHARLAAVAGATLAGRRVFAFAGIGRPAKFFATLAEAGAEVVGERSFADHHPYTAADLVALEEVAAEADATLITTAKDAVRLPPDAGDVAVLIVRLEWDDEAAVMRLLEPLL